MVDIDGPPMLPGSSPSNQFIGWTLADPDGKPAVGAARDLIVQLCEYTLHLDDFERCWPKNPFDGPVSAGYLESSRLVPYVRNTTNQIRIEGVRGSCKELRRLISAGFQGCMSIPG